MLALAIIGLMAAVLIGGAAQLLHRHPPSADDVFWQAVQAARKTALKSDQPVGFKFVIDDTTKGKSFVVTAADGTAQVFPLPGAGDLNVSFLIPETGGNVIMIAGTAIETETVPSVTFYPDGTCTAFRAQFVRNGATHILSIDQWTCAPVLTPGDSTGTSSS